MSVRIVDIREITKPISSPIRNAYIDFTKMTTSLVAVVTDAERDGRRVVGYGFNSNGRYGQGGLIRERFAPRLMEADPKTLLDEAGDNLDPDKIWAALMSNEKPGGHGERSVAVGTIEMAVWDAVAKIARKPPVRSGDRDRLCKDAARLSAVLVRGGRRSPGFPASGRARGILSRTDGDRRKPVQPSGCAQPHSLRRDAARPRLAAIRLRAVVWAVRVSAHAWRAAGQRLVSEPVYSAWRTSDVAEYRGRSRPRRQ